MGKNKKSNLVTEAFAEEQIEKIIKNIGVNHIFIAPNSKGKLIEQEYLQEIIFEDNYQKQYDINISFSRYKKDNNFKFLDKTNNEICRISYKTGSSFSADNLRKVRNSLEKYDFK